MIAFAIDALALVLTVAMLAILLTGGGTFAVGGAIIRAHSLGNIIVGVSLLTALRYRLRRIPLFLHASLPLVNAPELALRAVSAAMAWLEGLSLSRARVLLASVAVALTVVKAVLVVSHPGFFSGDDLEIHEMTLKAMFKTAWPIWDVRSAFFPLGFVYPAQWAARSAGVAEVQHLVMAGRGIVVVLSTATVLGLFAYARRRSGLPIAVVSSLLLATSSLYVEFGATELPRPVSALFVLAAFGMLSGSVGAGGSMASGALLGIAACFRFSEVVFVAPALLCLALDRRWRQAALLGATCAVTAGSIQMLSDVLYWKEPFHSARHIVDYTLVQRQSSRGFDPWWYYAREATAWSDLVVLGLALYASRWTTRLALWVWLPVLAFSILPHKEPRYLIPVTPLLCLLAAEGSVRLVRAIQATRGHVGAAIAAALVVAVPLRFVDQASKYRVARSDAEVYFARRLAPTLTGGSIVIEQNWRFGGHLYWPRDIQIVEWEFDATAEGIAEGTLQPQMILVSAGSCRATGWAGRMAELGYVEHPDPTLAGAYHVFRPRAP